RSYRITFVAEPVCWTEVPATRRTLRSQRRRWSCGLAETLWKHRTMIGNPRYGSVGILGMPHLLLFELLGPVVELVGVIAVALSFVFGLVSVWFAVLFLVVAVGYGMFLSFASMVVEELSYHRYRRWRDFGAGLAAGVVENIGFRQMHAWWRFLGVVDAVRFRESPWEALPRAGFTGAAAPTPAADPGRRDADGHDEAANSRVWWHREGRAQ
ncbi:MAG TPA: glycosyltransferase family 2 protein, partial [Acidimicrobiia bacterium]